MDIHSDVVVVGGGPAGLNAALYLGRGRKAVLLCDAGVPRNVAAEHMHGFGSRDGIAPAEFRRLSREQLAHYPNVELRQARVGAVERREGGFRVQVGEDWVDTRRILLAMGVVDVLPELPGFRELWGTSIVQCPYCHGWEVRDEAFGVLASVPALLEHAVFLQGWSRDVTVFTQGAFEVPAEQREKLTRLGLRIEERRIRALHGTHGQLESVELEDGTRVARRMLFAAPVQRQTELVTRLGLALDAEGFVKVNERGETSVPGISAAGDMTTRLQGALMAAHAGAIAAVMINHGLTLEAAEHRLARASSLVSAN